MLHAPDFLGYESAIAMAKDHPAVVELGLAIKKAGNELIALIGGREVHPINVRVGGFYRVPTKSELAPLREKLLRARDSAREAVAWVGKLPFPDFERDVELVAMSEPGEYPIDRGRLVSNRGLDIAPHEFEEHVVEEHVEHSNALYARMRGRGAYLAGPLARYNLNFERLSPLAQEAAREAGLGPECRNPFQSIVVRAVEILYAFDEAVRIIDGYEQPDRPAIPARAAGRDRIRVDRSSARGALPQLLAGRRGEDPERQDRAAYLTEPEVDRGGPVRARAGDDRRARGGAAAALRAGDSQL